MSDNFEDEDLYDEVKGASAKKSRISVLNKKQLDPWDLDEVFLS